MTPYPAVRHGTRASYHAGCRCRPCRLANAAYQDWYRRRRRAKAVLLGATIASDAAVRLLNQLRSEALTNTAIAHGLGLRSPSLKVHDRITVRRHLQIQRLHRRYMSEAADHEIQA